MLLCLCLRSGALGLAGEKDSNRNVGVWDRQHGAWFSTTICPNVRFSELTLGNRRWPSVGSWLVTAPAPGQARHRYG